MKLKRKINKDAYELLTDVQKTLYVEQNGDYVLDIDDDAFVTLKAEKKKAESELKRYQDDEAERIRKAEERAEKRAKEQYEKDRTDKNVDAIEKAWQDKYQILTDKYEALAKNHSDFVKTSLIDGTVEKMANELATVPNLIKPHIKSRLDVEIADGIEPKLIVLNEKGERSASTIDELKKSFIDNKEYASIIKVTTANGGAKGGIEDKIGDRKEGKRLGDLSDDDLARYAQERYGNVEE